jgi:hypothetical protein
LAVLDQSFSFRRITGGDKRDIHFYKISPANRPKHLLHSRRNLHKRSRFFGVRKTAVFRRDHFERKGNKPAGGNVLEAPF